MFTDKKLSDIKHVDIPAAATVGSSFVFFLMWASLTTSLFLLSQQNTDGLFGDVPISKMFKHAFRSLSTNTGLDLPRYYRWQSLQIILL